MTATTDVTALRKWVDYAERLCPCCDEMSDSADCTCFDSGPGDLSLEERVAATKSLLDEVERLELAVQSCPDCEDLATDCVKAEDRATKLEVEVERLRGAEVCPRCGGAFPFDSGGGLVACAACVRRDMPIASALSILGDQCVCVCVIRPPCQQCRLRAALTGADE